MIPDSIASLLDARPEDLASAELRGPWDLLTVRNGLLDVEAQLRSGGASRARLLIGALKNRFPFDYVKAYTEPGDERTRALAATFGVAPNPSPTPFLPVAVFVVAVDGAASDLTDDELSMLAGYGIAALSKLGADERGAAGAAALLRDTCRILRDAGAGEGLFARSKVIPAFGEDADLTWRHAPSAQRLPVG